MFQSIPNRWSTLLSRAPMCFYCSLYSYFFLSVFALALQYYALVMHHSFFSTSNRHGSPSYYFREAHNLPSNFMEQRPSWSSISAAIQEILHIVRSSMVITIFARGHYTSHSWNRSFQTTPSHPVSIKSILFLSSQPSLGFPNLRKHIRNKIEWT